MLPPVAEMLPGELESGLDLVGGKARRSFVNRHQDIVGEGHLARFRGRCESDRLLPRGVTVREDVINARSASSRSASAVSLMLADWPLAERSIGTAEAETAVVGPRTGGRWFDCGVDGSECEWGKVIAYEPPGRLVLNWQIGADWRYDPTLHTEVEIRFVAEVEARARVELEHRGLAAYGEQAEQMRSLFDSPDAWSDILARYAESAT